MRKRYKRKKRSCPLCKPQKTEGMVRWKKKDLEKLKEYEEESRLLITH